MFRLQACWGRETNYNCGLPLSNIPSSLKELLLRRGTTYNLRGKDILTMPKVYSIKQGLRSRRYLAPKIWNALAEAVRHETKLSSFKRRLKKN